MTGERDKHEFGVQTKLRQIRKQKGLRLREVAERVGTTTQTIHRLETGGMTISVSWLGKLAEAYSVDIFDLFERGVACNNRYLRIELAAQIAKTADLKRILYATASTRGANDALILRMEDAIRHACLRVGDGADKALEQMINSLLELRQLALTRTA
jgi:transcriptional regulator with XRE-family HTH domain